MKYVTDLSKVTKDEIRHIYKDREIVSITVLPDKPINSSAKVVVCFREYCGFYCLDGRYSQNDPHSSFVYKPKQVRYLRTINELVEAGYELSFDAVGSLDAKNSHQGASLSAFHFRDMGKPFSTSSEGCAPCWDEVFTVMKEEA